MRPVDRSQRSLVVAAATGALLATGGCTFLYPPFDPEASVPIPTIIASYSTGDATMTMASDLVITFPDVADGATVDSEYGSSVRWFGPDGWSLSVIGAGAAESSYFPVYLIIDRISDGQHLTIFDPDRCIVDIDQVDASGLLGSATCRGLAWTDALDNPLLFGSPKPIGDPFDAEIAFGARP